ncbi:hypothetical protein EFK68_03685 [Pseudomonas aeruginosa]|uniref:hypothetical protein n=1 Tax=Pseudomonas aeruginosa TaxID=287 RepID=UPI000F6A8E5E|nr:hypothetical protein [Pseudomonas aeruginosa]EKF7416877.1 hypothetical protein [Pseudomonas aeruginosa]MDS9918419.1 hypothetical protein [Pseudomonas aeruginosa]RNF58489.1 hypothetical protein EFK68_03685 [Pseudomonas aeruginosa]HCA5866508.1 hypothetical protein [Pseudomonas aeruginosa]HCA7376625.1 hypothetical protein [Pseudomonas aeruginosa]
MPSHALSSNDVKLLSQILHTTSKTIGRPSKLAAHREMLSRVLGFRDWNSACALLPEHSNQVVTVALSQLEVPGLPARLMMAIGNDAPWRLPALVREHLVSTSQDPAGFTVRRYSRPDPVSGVMQRYWEFTVSTETGHGRPQVHKVPLAIHTPDYGRRDLTPVVATLANAQGQEAFTLTVWNLTLQSSADRTATCFAGASSVPLYNTFVESITGQAPELRQANCLVSSRAPNFSNAIVRCDEMGRELEVVEHLPYMQDDKLWALLAPYNSELGLSMLDVADITEACFVNDSE